MRLVITAATGNWNETLYDSAYDDYTASRIALSEVLNEAPTLDLRVPSNSLSHVSVADLVPLKSIIEARHDGSLIFRGRAFQPYESFYLEKGIICEGELAFFKDSVMPAGTYTGTPAEQLAAVLSAHNAMVEPFKRFALGNVTITASASPVTIKDASSCSSVLGALISAYGGYLTFTDGRSGRHINWLDGDAFGEAGQPIELGRNMMDYSMQVNPNAFANRIYAFGAEVNGTRLSLPSPGYLEDAASIASYGTVAKVVIFNDIKDGAELTARAQRALNEARNIIETISVSAIDLSRAVDPVSDSEDIAERTWKLGQLVRVISPAHGVDARYRLTARSCDLLDPANDRITLGGDPITLWGELS